MSDTTSELRVERQDEVLRLTIDRPHRRNALTDAVMFAMRDAIAATAGDSTLRAIVLTGSGEKAQS